MSHDICHEYRLAKHHSVSVDIWSAFTPKVSAAKGSSIRLLSSAYAVRRRALALPSGDRVARGGDDVSGVAISCNAVGPRAAPRQTAFSAAASRCAERQPESIATPVPRLARCSAIDGAGAQAATSIACDVVLSHGTHKFASTSLAIAEPLSTRHASARRGVFAGQLRGVSAFEPLLLVLEPRVARPGALQIVAYLEAQAAEPGGFQFDEIAILKAA